MARVTCVRAVPPLWSKDMSSSRVLERGARLFSPTAARGEHDEHDKPACEKARPATPALRMVRIAELTAHASTVCRHRSANQGGWLVDEIGASTAVGAKLIASDGRCFVQ